MQRKEFLWNIAGCMAGLLLLVGSFGTAHAQFGGFFNGNKRDTPINVSSYPANVQQEYKAFQHTCSECHTLDRGLRVTQTPAMAKYWVLQMQAMPAADFNGKQATGIIDFINYHQSHLPQGQQPEASSSVTTETPAPTAAAAALAGKQYFDSAPCVLCHTTGISNSPKIISLAGVGEKLSREQMVKVLHGGKASLGMPAIPASTTSKDLDNLIAYLQSLKGK